MCEIARQKRLRLPDKSSSESASKNETFWVSDASISSAWLVALLLCERADLSVGLQRSMDPYQNNVESSWHVMAHGGARERAWRENWRIEWVASTLHTTSELGVSSITTTDTHTSAASSRLNWRPCRFNLSEPCVLYIGRAYRYPPNVAFYIYIFATDISTEYFKHAAHSPFFLFKMPFIS